MESKDDTFDRQRETRMVKDKTLHIHLCNMLFRCNVLQRNGFHCQITMELCRT